MELVDGQGSAIPVFMAELEKPHSPDAPNRLRVYHEKLQEQYEQVEYNKNFLEQPSQHNQRSEDVETENDALGEPMEAANAMADFDAAMRDDGRETLEGNLQKMNIDQRRIFDLVSSHLASDKEQLFMYLSGAGGTGKSFLCNTLKLWAKHHYGNDTNTIAVVAPTGLAAYNVNGITLHRLLQLPVQHGSTARYSSLPDDVCKELRAKLKHLKVLVLDEISMVSNLMLAYTHLRLNQVFNCDEDAYFGGLHIIVMGDFMQLSPVGKDVGPVFCDLTSEQVANKIGGLAAANLWKDKFTNYDELQMNMRQKDDPEYAAILDRLRFGQSTLDDIKKMQQRLIAVSDEKGTLNALGQYYADLRNSGRKIVCLLSKSDMVKVINDSLLAREKADIVDITADDVIEYTGPRRTKNRDQVLEILSKREGNVTETAGIKAVLRLCIGARVMLRRNLSVEDGLVNGAIGTVIGFIKNNAKVAQIEVKFDNLRETKRIARCTVKFPIVKGVNVHRSQFPLILSYAMTIHKSQGLSLDDVMVDAGNTVFEKGMTYVALSRVRTLQGLHLINFDPSRAAANDSCLKEINRLRTAYQPAIPLLNGGKNRLPWVADRLWCDAMVPGQVCL